MAVVDVTVSSGIRHASENPACRAHGGMRTLALVADRQFVPPDMPVMDTEVPIDAVATALPRMESRQVFGKIIVHL